MFEPRPEIRIATRARSAMVGGGPGFARAPGVGGAADGAAHRALPRFGRCVKTVSPAASSAGVTLRRHRRRDDRDHADAAVEGAGQFARLDRAAGLQEGEQAG